MAPKVAILIYSMYGHIAKMAEAEKAGVEAAGGQAEILQVAETLPQEVLDKMHAPPKPSYRVVQPADIVEYDGVLFGIPTRYGNMPAQWKAFWDASGGQWQTGGFFGKYAGAFVSTGGPGGGQESTVLSCMSTFVHHGWLFVPLGYARTFADTTNLTEPHGGSPWGAGTFSAADGSRQPSELELRMAKAQGQHFYETVAKVK